MAGRLLESWLKQHELQPEGQGYRWTVEVGKAAAGGSNVTLEIEPSPWGEKGPYTTGLAHALVDWAVKGDPFSPPDPAKYLPKVPASQYA